MATTKKEKDFKFFSKLPQELQDQVWDTTGKLSILMFIKYISLSGHLKAPVRLKESVLVPWS